MLLGGIFLFLLCGSWGVNSVQASQQVPFPTKSYKRPKPHMFVSLKTSISETILILFFLMWFCYMTQAGLTL